MSYTDAGAQTAATSNLGGQDNLNNAPNYDIQTPAQWAQSQLEYMNLPVTQSNIDFLVSWAAREGGNWDNTASYNPLNTTLQYQGSSVMSGGNTAGVQAYSSWQDGIAATAQTLQGYQQIVDALQAGDAMQADQGGQLGSDLSKWSGGGYTSVTSSTGYGSDNQQFAGNQGGSGGASGGASGLSMSDIPQVVAYIKQNYGTDAWLLNIPSVATVLEQAVVNGDDAAQVQAAIEQTEWWKTTSQAVKNYEQNLANNPADYGPNAFQTQGSIASQTLAQVQQAASQAGVNLSPQQEQELATNYMQYGWTSQQLQQAIGSLVTYTGPGHTDAGSVIQQLTSAAGQYLMNVSPQTLQSWAQNIAAGTQTIQQFNAYLAQNASLKWTGMASQIAQGYTPYQITDSLRNDAAQIMETDPTNIDFLNNPFYSQILDYAPANGNGVHRMMTQSEMAQYLKGSQQWGYTQQGRDQAATLEQAITSTFGKAPA